MQESHKVQCFSVISGGDAAAMFQPAKCSFHDIAFLVYVARIAAFADTVRFGRDAGLCARSDDRVDDQLAVVALVRDDVFCRYIFNQFRRNGKIGDIAAR